MRINLLPFSILLTIIFAAVATPDDKKLSPKGVVIDLCGPPQDGNFKLDYLITLEGEKMPTRHTLSCAGWDTDAEGNIVFWGNSEFILEKVSDTQVRFVGKKGPAGKIIPVVNIKLESKDLRPEQLPKVVIDPKTRG
jgi:hypothetical protein